MPVPPVLSMNSSAFDPLVCWEKNASASHPESLFTCSTPPIPELDTSVMMDMVPSGSGIVEIQELHTDLRILLNMSFVQATFAGTDLEVDGDRTAVSVARS